MKKLLFIIPIIILAITVVGIYLLNNNSGNNEINKTKETLLLKDDLNVEINSEIRLLSFVSENNKVKTISEDKIIDTSKLGEQELTIKYLDNGNEEEYTFKINIIDREKPIIEYQKEKTITVGTKVDLLKDVKVSDNSKEEIKATIKGEYNINKVGTYNLKYVAEDSSKNKTEEEFILKVNEKVKKEETKTTIKTNTKENTNTSNSNRTYEEAIKEGEVYKNYAEELFNSYQGKYYTSPIKFDNKYPDNVELVIYDYDFWLECGEYRDWNLRTNAPTNKQVPRSKTYNAIMMDLINSDGGGVEVLCEAGSITKKHHYYYVNSYWATF